MKQLTVSVAVILVNLFCELMLQITSTRKHQIKNLLQLSACRIFLISMFVKELFVLLSKNEQVY